MTMQILNPIYSGVKVKRKVVQATMAMVKNKQYYRKLTVEEQMECLRGLAKLFSVYYDVPEPMVELGLFPCYLPMIQTILLDKPSIISFLHEYRHHLQHTAGKRYKGMTVEQDARAWSLRVFSAGFPKMLEKAVKENKVYFVKWSDKEQRIVDDAPYV